MAETIVQVPKILEERALVSEPDREYTSRVLSVVI